jgi:hypothetical protein
MKIFMETFLLDLKFKGDRKYIQGPDIYNKVLEYLYNKNHTIKNIDLSFHKIAKRNLQGRLFTGNASIDVVSAVSVLKFKNKLNEPFIIHLSETDTEITDRYEYNERQITEPAVLNVNDKSISLSSETPYTNIEKIVSLNKALLNNLLPDPGKWYFTKLTVDRDINKEVSAKTKLVLTKNIGSKLTKTQILFDEIEKGYLYFSKV